MQRNSLIYFLFLFVLSSFLFYNCAGTKKETDDSYAAGETQQQDLEDIEALLGITSDIDDRKEEPQPKPQNTEQLDLLETDEMVGQQDNSMASAALAQQDQKSAGDAQEVTRLKNEIRQKDRAISSLETQVALKDSEIRQLSSQPAATSFGTVETDVSAEDYEARYRDARSFFEARKYQKAIEQFEALLASSSSHSLSDNAQYWIGESHFALRQFDTAIIDFEKVLTFARSNKKADAQFKLGYCYLVKGQKEKALDEFDRLKADYPNSTYNSKAERLIAKY